MIDSLKVISETQLIIALNKARNCEMIKQFEEGREALSAIWKEITDPPIVQPFSEIVQAEILLRCGCFLSWYAHSKQIKHLNLTARDWLTRSHRLFESNNGECRVSEVETEIALTYWREGASEDALVWVESALAKSGNEMDHARIKTISTYILILTFLRRFKEAFKVVEIYDNQVLANSDCRDKTHYYLNTALLLVESGHKKDSLSRLLFSIENAKEAGNIPYLAVAENNIGNIYKDLEMYDEALDSSYQAEQRLKILGDKYRLGCCYDSRAQIYLAMGKNIEALHFVEKSLELLENGEEYWGTVESLWTKVRIHIAQSQKLEALTTFSQLISISTQRLSEKITKQYEQDFTDFFYLKKQIPFENEVLCFEQELISKALNQVETDNKVTEAAKLLGMKHQTLSNALKKRHRELKKRFNIKIKSPRNDIKLKTHTFDECEIRLPASIKPTLFLRIEENRLDYLGLTPGVLAVCVKMQNEKLPLVVRDTITEEVFCGFADSHCGIIGLFAGENEPILVDESRSEILGNIIGFCNLQPTSNSYEYQEIKI